MRYVYTAEKDGNDYQVIETDTQREEGDCDKRVIAACRNRDDATLIRRLYEMLEQGKIDLARDYVER